MNESKIPHTVPAANELNKVPGFDPMQHLQRAVNAQGESVMQLKPRYQRLWFRLVYPMGRMLLNPLRVTDQLAIFEAKVFFHKDDPTPASSFTSNKTVQETPNYIRAAQDEALKEALDNAGFGIQLCDLNQAVDDERHSPSAKASGNEPAVEKADPIPVQATPAPVQETSVTSGHTQPVQPVVVKTQPVDHPKMEEVPAAEPAPKPAADAQLTAQATESVSESMERQDAPQAASQETVPQEKTDPVDSQQPVLAAVLNFPAPAEEPPALLENAAADTAVSNGPADTAPSQAETPPQAAPGYTDDTPVDEILPLMTMEEAQAVVVPRGPCMGWTMAQVAEKRPSSLRFFLTSFCECSNIQKAAATLLMQDLEQKKAG